MFVCIYRHYQAMVQRRAATTTSSSVPLDPAYNPDCNSCMMIHVGEKACNSGVCQECGAVPHRMKE